MPIGRLAASRYERNTTNLDHVLYTTVRVRLHHSLHPDQGFHVRCESVGHQVELSVWWDERYRAIVLKTS